MEYALQVSGDYETVLDAARSTEQHQLAAIALIDHYLMSEDEAKASHTPAHDAFVQLGALARETETVELVVLVSPVTFRHPAVLYKSAVTIDHLSDGRSKLGIGSGCAHEAAETADRDPDGLLLSYNSPVPAFDSEEDMDE